jgi:hypothetical protein
MPILPGLPSFWSKAASTPINAPTPMTPHRVANPFFPISLSLLRGIRKKWTAAKKSGMFFNRQDRPKAK